jgi:hypothetical protein
MVSDEKIILNPPIIKGRWKLFRMAAHPKPVIGNATRLAEMTQQGLETRLDRQIRKRLITAHLRRRVFLAGLGGAGAALGHEALAEAAPSRSPPQMRVTGGVCLLRKCKAEHDEPFSR